VKLETALSIAVGTTLMLLVTASKARSDDPVTSAVRFNREVVRIFDRKCLACHSPGGIAMSLATYRDVRPWGRAIREEIVEQRMPPWSAARGYSRFKDDIALTPRELGTILTWVDGGMPRGDESDLPRAAPATGAAPAAEPEHSVAIPPQQIPGDNQDVIRRITVDAGVTADRWIRQVQVRPGDRRILRAAFVSIEAEGREPIWAGAWTPWQNDTAPPATGAFLIPRGARLAIELHYRGQDGPTIDRSSIAMFAASGDGLKPLTSVTVGSADDATSKAAAADKPRVSLKRESLVWGIRTRVPMDGASLELTAQKPDGTREVLLWIPKARAEWPAPYIFQDPVRLPAGTAIVLTARNGRAVIPAAATLTLHPLD
jgi:hypothetical protein